MLPLVVFLACGGEPRPSPEGEPADLVEAGLPERVAFGQVAVGQQAEVVVDLTNAGGRAGAVTMSVSGHGAFAVDPGVVELPAGGTGSVTLTFRPTDPGRVRGTVELEMDGEGVAIELVGTGLAPVLVLPGDLDMGSVYVGCQGVGEVVVGNAGNADLSLSAVELLDGDGFGVGDLSPAGPIAPGATASIPVTFTPSAPGLVEDALRLQTDDPAAPTAGLTLAGEALDGTVTVTFVVPAPSVDLLLMIEDTEALEDRLGVLRAAAEPMVTALADVDGRIGVMSMRAPDLLGFVDATDGGAGEALGALLAYPAEPMRGPVAGLDTLFAAVSAGGDVGRGSAFLRDEPAFIVVALVDEVDHSGTSWASVSTAVKALEVDKTRARVDVIAGDWVEGCDDYSAAPGWYELSVATGGTYASICASDYSGLFEAVRDELLAASASDLELVDFPVESTLAVTIDGVAAAGWSYSGVDNRVVLEPAAPVGSTVTVTYTPARLCE